MTEIDVASTIQPEKLVLTTTEICKVLELSKPTVLALTHRDDDPLPVVRVGRSFRYPVKLVEMWLERQAQKNT